MPGPADERIKRYLGKLSGMPQQQADKTSPLIGYMVLALLFVIVAWLLHSCL